MSVITDLIKLNALEIDILMSISNIHFHRNNANKLKIMNF